MAACRQQKKIIFPNEIPSFKAYTKTSIKVVNKNVSQGYNQGRKSLKNPMHITMILALIYNIDEIQYQTKTISKKNQTYK